MICQISPCLGPAGTNLTRLFLYNYLERLVEAAATGEQIAWGGKKLQFFVTTVLVIFAYKYVHEHLIFFFFYKKQPTVIMAQNETYSGICHIQYLILDP